MKITTINEIIDDLITLKLHRDTSLSSYKQIDYIIRKVTLLDPICACKYCTLFNNLEDDARNDCLDCINGSNYILKV